MEVVIQSYFGEGSGVSEDLFGELVATLSCEDSDQLLMISEILSCIAQKRDVNIKFYAF